MAITTKATLLVRRGLEQNFDASKMKQGEWALSTDNRYIRMCVANGVCLRMATYDAFEKDMAKIEAILANCQSIERAIIALQTVINNECTEFIYYVDEKKSEILQSVNTAVATIEREKNEATESINASVQAVNAKETEISDFVDDSIETIDNKTTQLSDFVDDSMLDINNLIDSYETDLQTIIDAASQDFNQIKAEAEGFVDDSEEYAILSRSWAIGDTETRSGETVNNSKYYSELSKSEKESCASYAQESKDYLDATKKEVSGYVFWVDENDGCLYVDTDNTVQTFSIDADGYLCVEV